MATNSNQAIFGLLPEGKPRWKSFGSAAGIEFVALALLIWVPVLLPQRFNPIMHFMMTPIAAPPVVAWKPQPYKPAMQPKKIVVVKRDEPKPLPPPPVAEVVKPKLIAPVFSAPIAKPGSAHRDAKRPDMPEVAQTLPKVNEFSGGSSALPTLRKPREAVQTGGFGDPNGVPDNGRRDRSPNIATLGSYDMPAGPGYGNGTGGAKGARGVVASSGFGNGVAIGGGGNGKGRAGVQQGVFADQRPTTEAPKVRQTSTSSGKTTPAVILFKPKPVYTQQAIDKRIEGDVLLEVAFSATGEVQVLGVKQGLGYGLDETAVTAAKQIRFKPAQQDGHPVDSTAVVHIVYELAY
ncbi:MAG: energy transducer TonB [Candidatus Acidiferrales bacterium]